MSDTTSTTDEPTGTAPAEEPATDETPKRSTRKRSTRKTGGSKSDSTPKRGSRNARSLKRPLEDLFTSVGAVVYAFQPFDGACVIAGAPDLAKSLDELAKSDPRVQAALERLVTTSTYGAVFSAVGAIALPIAANHRALPEQMVQAGVGMRAMSVMEQRKAEAEQAAAEAAAQAAQEGQAAA